MGKRIAIQFGGVIDCRNAVCAKNGYDIFVTQLELINRCEMYSRSSRKDPWRS